jgi:cGMP-dependent protein kinase 2
MKEQLKKCFLFQNWSDKDLDLLKEISEERNLNVGQSLFLENSAADTLFVVKSGSINIQKSGGDDDQYIAHIEAGSYLGEMGLLAEGQAEKRSATATVRESASVLAIPYARLEALLKEKPELGALFYKNMARALGMRIKRTTQDLASLKTLRLRNV